MSSHDRHELDAISMNSRDYISCHCGSQQSIVWYVRVISSQKLEDHKHIDTSIAPIDGYCKLTLAITSYRWVMNGLVKDAPYDIGKIISMVLKSPVPRLKKVYVKLNQTVINWMHLQSNVFNAAFFQMFTHYIYLQQ